MPISLMAGLNKLSDVRRCIVEDPEVRGGLPVVYGTRISVYEIADALSSDGLEITLEDFPALSREDVEAAALYAREYPRKRRSLTGLGSRRLVSEEIIDLTDAV